MEEHDYVVCMNVDLDFYIIAENEDQARQEAIRQLKGLDVNYDILDIDVSE